MNLKIAAMIFCGTMMGTSCQRPSNPVIPDEVNEPVTPVEEEYDYEEIATLLEALEEGAVMKFTFNLDGEDIEVAFMFDGEEFVLLDEYGDEKAATRADEQKDQEELKKYNFEMKNDKEKGLIYLTVTDKESGKLVLTATMDVKQNTVKVEPADPNVKVEEFKVNVNDKVVEPTLADALKDKAVVVINYDQNNVITTFTFTNNGGKFECTKTEGYNAATFKTYSSLKVNGSTLIFDAVDEEAPDVRFTVHFDTEKNTYRYWNRENGDDFTISVNGTELKPKLNNIT